ncbi:hypothetical protein X975_22966, partial [Stegodyphus mimosarum]
MVLLSGDITCISFLRKASYKQNPTNTPQQKKQSAFSDQLHFITFYPFCNVVYIFQLFSPYT